MTFKQLSSGDQALLLKMQSVYYGHLDKIPVRNGHATLAPETRKFRFHKIGAVIHWHTGETGKTDFVLNEKHLEFFSLIKDITDGFINEIQIQAGLPVSLETEEAAIHI